MQHIRAIERAVVVVAVVVIECESQVTQEVVHGRSVVCPGDPLRDSDGARQHGAKGRAESRAANRPGTA